MHRRFDQPALLLIQLCVCMQVNRMLAMKTIGIFDLFGTHV